MVLLAVLAVSTSGCKKEDQTSNTSLDGLWKCTLLTIANYDSLNNFIRFDTVIYTDSLENTVTLLERYSADHSFYAFANTVSDTLFKSTYTLDGNIIRIHLPDSVLPFNARTILTLDEANLAVSQMITIGPYRQKWVQTYARQ